MKRIFAWLLLLTLMVGLFAGCKKTETETPTEPQEVTNGAQEAIDYLKAYYTDSGAQTPVDYTRFGIVRIGGVAYDVVWTVDVGEDLIKIVKNEDGTYTIDINEDAAEDTEYTLTATVTDANGNTASFSWKYILPKAQDMVAIVEAAYALKNGESLPYESRLRGKVISIDSIWSDDYQNITVTIAIEGIEDKPIKCYRMKAGSDLAEVIKNIQVGNIITVVGTLKNYEGTIEFDAGCQLIAWEKGDAVDAPTDPGEILKQAYALKDGQALPYVATLTGVVTKIDNPYDPAYGNISVVIEVEGYAKYPILCYRLKGLGVDQIAVDDLITVTGIIKNYKGTIEFDTGCQMTERVSGGGVAQRPSSDADKIIRDAKKLNPGESLPYRATLTGEIVSVDNAYDSSYGNVTVTIKVKGVKFQCYRLTGDGVDKIRETDTITVSGVIKNYNGKLEFDKGCTLDSWKKGPRNVNYGSAEEGVAYRLYLKQETLGQTLYFSGAVNGSRLQTTTTASKGADVFVEKISGKGVRFYYLSGTTKNYIEIEEYTTDDGKQRGAAKITTTPSCYWVYNSDVGCYIVNLPTAGKYFLGTYNSYNTITASWIGYVDGSMTSSSAQYIAHYAKADTVKDEAPKETVVQGTPVANPVVGTAYKFGFHQNQIDGKPFQAFAGRMQGFYYATTNVMSQMTDVYLEAASGGYYIYFLNDGTKTYLDVVPREDKEGAVNVVLQTKGTHSIYKLNTEHKYVYTTCIGEEWYLGTYGSNISISASKTSYISDKSTIGVSQFCAWFSTVAEVAAPDPEPTDPPVTLPPDFKSDVVAAPKADTAYKMGMNIDGTIYYFTGKTADKSYYLATTTDPAYAIDVKLEAANGGYRLYFMNGNTKTYIRVYHRTADEQGRPGYAKGSLELVTKTPDEIFTIDPTINTLFYKYSDNDSFFMGTYGTYTTISVSNTSYATGKNAANVDVAQFPVRFYTFSGNIPTPTTPPATTAPQPGETVVAPQPVATPAANTAYKFGFNQNQVDGKPFLAFAGKMSGYYYATTDKQADMTDVKLEAVSGGYHIYFMDNGTKTYLDVVPRENKEGAVNVVLQTSGTHSVYQLNTEHKYVYTTCIGEEWYLGTYGTNKSISASKTSYIEDTSKIGESQFCAWFNTLETVVVPPSTEPPVTQPPVTQPTGPAPTIPQNYVALYNPDSGKVATSTNKPYNSKDQLATADATLSGGMLTTSAYDVLALLQIDNGDGTVSFKTTDGKFLHADGTHVNLSASENDNTRFVLETTDGGYFIKLANATYNSKAQYLEYYAGSITSYGMNDTRANIYTFAFYPVTVVSTPTPTEPPVTNPPATEPAGESYVKITDASQFTTGKYVMIVNTGYAPGVVDGTWLTAVQPVVSDNTVTDAKGGVWTLTVNGSSVVIADSTGAMIGPKGGNSNGLSSGSYDWAWSFANGTFKFAGTGDDTVVLASNASTTGQYPGNHRFRGYKTTTVANDPATYPSEFTLYKLEGGSTEPDPSTPVTTAPPASNPPAGNGVTEVTELQAETAYKLAMNMNGTMGYFNGEVGNKAYYLGVTADHTQAVDVKLEAADGGYRMYFMDGTTKTYIRMYYKEADSKVRIEMTTTQPAEVVTYDDELRAIVFDDGTHDAYYMGSFGSYTTDISTSALSYISGDNASKIDVSQYPARFYTVEEGSEPPASNPPASSSNVVAEPQAETAYKMGMNISGTVYYFTGSTASQAWYLATSTNVADAIDVKLETADGGYYLYFMNGDVKTYIRVYQRTAGNPGEGKGSLELATAAPSEVFTFDETVKTLFYAYDSDNAYYMGTYGTYTNISASNTSYITGDNAANVDVSQFPARFYTVEAGGEPSVTEPDNTTAPTEPDNTTAPSEPTVPAQVKITFADLTKGTQYVAEHRDLDHGITLDTNNGCHITTQLRIYQDANYNGNAVFTCPKTLESVVINAGYKLANMVVYASEDGSQWDEVYNGALSSTTYTDYPITMPSGKDYKYLKIDSTSEQIRIQTITFNFKSE